MVIQFLLILILATALGLTWRRARQGALSRFAAALWSLLWFAAGVVTLLPDTASVFARFVGVGRGADAVIYLAIVLLYYLVFRIFVRLEKIDRDVTKLVREIAQREAGEPPAPLRD